MPRDKWTKPLYGLGGAMNICGLLFPRIGIDPKFAAVLQRPREFCRVALAPNDRSRNLDERSQAISIARERRDFGFAIISENIPRRERRGVVDAEVVVAFGSKPMFSPPRFQRRQAENILHRHVKLVGRLLRIGEMRIDEIAFLLLRWVDLRSRRHDACTGRSLAARPIAATGIAGGHARLLGIEPRLRKRLGNCEAAQCAVLDREYRRRHTEFLGFCQLAVFDDLGDPTAARDGRIGIVVVAEGETVQLGSTPTEAKENDAARPALYNM